MEEWRHLDIDSWSVNDEEIPESGVAPAQIANANANANAEGSSYSRGGEASATATATATQEAAGKNINIEKSKSKCRKKSRSSRFSNEMEIFGCEEGVTGKKLDHNAKERIRRMKLNASYLALRALLPDSRRSKKKWSAPAIVDRVLKYIPELEKEVEALKCSKEGVQTSAKYESPTISLNQLNQHEAILQLCMATPQQPKLAHLLQRVEDEGMCIKSASALDISHTRISHHLHIQTTSEASHHFEELRDKVISWLR